MEKTLIDHPWGPSPVVLALSAILTLPVAWANADCLTQSDLVAGLTVEFDDGSVEGHRTHVDGQVKVEQAGPRGVVDRWILANGIYHIAHDRLKDGEPVANSGYTVRYRTSPRRMPIPTGRGTWATTSMMTLSPDPPFEQKETFIFGPSEVFSLGGCDYDVIRIESTTVSQGDTDIVGMIFFRSIGTSFVTELYGEPWRMPVRLERGLRE